MLTKDNESQVFDFIDGKFEALDSPTLLPLAKKSEQITSVCLSPSEDFMFVSYHYLGVYGIRSYCVKNLASIMLSDNTAFNQNKIGKNIILKNFSYPRTLYLWDICPGNKSV